MCGEPPARTYSPLVIDLAPYEIVDLPSLYSRVLHGPLEVTEARSEIQIRPFMP